MVSFSACCVFLFFFLSLSLSLLPISSSELMKMYVNKDGRVGAGVKKKTRATVAVGGDAVLRMLPSAGLPQGLQRRKKKKEARPEASVGRQ